VTGLLAFLTQYDAELGGTALATLIVGFGVLQLRTGRSPDLRRFRPDTIRVVGAQRSSRTLAHGAEPRLLGTNRLTATSCLI
jgi:hypothetical protein